MVVHADGMNVVEDEGGAGDGPGETGIEEALTTHHYNRGLDHLQHGDGSHGTVFS